MRCRQARRLLERNETGMLPAREKERLAEHLRGCAGCRQLSRQLDLTWNVLGCHPLVEPSADFLEQVKERLRKEPVEKLPPRVSHLRPAWQWMALAACALLAALILGRNVGFFSDSHSVPSDTIVLSEPDMRDDEFLKDLEQTLRHSDAEYLSIYDSWPGYLQDGQNLDSSKGGGMGDRGKGRKEIS
jgi:hypothetical protein